MPKFLAIHPLPAPMTVEEGTPIAKKIKDNCTEDAKWVSSWIQCNAEGKLVKTFCQWDAVSVEAIEKVLAKVPELPTEGIYPIVLIDPSMF